MNALEKLHDAVKAHEKVVLVGIRRFQPWDDSHTR